MLLSLLWAEPICAPNNKSSPSYMHVLDVIRQPRQQEHVVIGYVYVHVPSCGRSEGRFGACVRMLGANMSRVRVWVDYLSVNIFDVDLTAVHTQFHTVHM